MTTHIRQIRSQTDLNSTLARIETLWGSPTDTPEGDELEVLLALVEVYEAKHCEIPAGDPIEVIRYKLKELEIGQNTLAGRLGWTSGRVSEVLNRKRPLTLAMIRALADVLGVPPGLLVGQERDGIPAENTIVLPTTLLDRVRARRTHPSVGLDKMVIRLLEQALAAEEKKVLRPAAPLAAGAGNGVSCFRFSENRDPRHEKVAA